MALIQGRIERIDIPHEPGQWFEFRRLSVRQLEEQPGLSTLGMDKLTEAERAGLALRWVRACVVGWSYAVPFSQEVCGDLDLVTTVWAFMTAWQRTSGVESVPEKNADSPGSIGILMAIPAAGVQTSGS